MYCSITDVRNTIGITDTSVLPDATITTAIQFAEDEIDRLTNTTFYPPEVSGTATTAGTTTLTDSSKTWVTNAYTGYSVYIYSGTGAGQIREILSNTSTVLTVATWTTALDTTSKYYISYLNKITELYDGNNRNVMILDKCPVIQIDSLTIAGTSVTPTNVYIYNYSGKISLKSTAEKTLFSPLPNTDNKLIVSVTYHYGVIAVKKHNSLDMPFDVKRLAVVIAGLNALGYHMGGSYTMPDQFALPDYSATKNIGTKIKMNIDNLVAERDKLIAEVVGKYAFIY